MNVNEYQALAMRTDRQGKNRDQKLINAALGLTGEAGEFADHVKKFYFQVHALDRHHLKQELGDILWYIAQAATALECSMEEIMYLNIEKLERRYPAGKFEAHRSTGRKE